MIYPFSYLVPSSEAFALSSSKVSGADGDLIILSGQTVDIPEGSVKQYNSVRIDAGGTLNITGNTGAITEIGCRGNFTLNGNIIARRYGTSGSWTKTGTFGQGSLSYSVTQAAGGTGGSGNWYNSASYYTSLLPGYPVDGQGGGGAGGGPAGGYGGVTIYTSAGGNAGSPGTAGTVYNNTPTGTYRVETAAGSGGAATNFLGDGQNGGNANTFYRQAAPNNTLIAGSGGQGFGGGGAGCVGAYYSTYTSKPDQFGRTTTTVTVARYIGGGGGGGARKGSHGLGLCLYIEGQISGTGVILANGNSGYKGGNGGASGADSGYGNGTMALSAKGGGGGAGGSGGRVWVYYKGSITTPTFAVSVSGGAGGAGGAQGGVFDGDPGGTNVQATAGASGTAGTSQIISVG